MGRPARQGGLFLLQESGPSVMIVDSGSGREPGHTSEVIRRQARMPTRQPMQAENTRAASQEPSK